MFEEIHSHNIWNWFQANNNTVSTWKENFKNSGSHKNKVHLGCQIWRTIENWFGKLWKMILIWIDILIDMSNTSNKWHVLSGEAIMALYISLVMKVKGMARRSTKFLHACKKWCVKKMVIPLKSLLLYIPLLTPLSCQTNFLLMTRV